MHELAIARSVLDIALEHSRGHRVTAVSLKVGALRQVVPTSLEFCFEVVARETACEGASLEQEPVAALLRCTECGREWDPAPPAAETEDELAPAPSFRCPGCGAGGGTVVRGEELEVETIEIEDEQRDGEPCTAPR